MKFWAAGRLVDFAISALIILAVCGFWLSVWLYIKYNDWQRIRRNRKHLRNMVEQESLRRTGGPLDL